MLKLKYIYLGKLRQVLCVILPILTKGKLSLLTYSKGRMSHLEGTYKRQPCPHQPYPYQVPCYSLMRHYHPGSWKQSRVTKAKES